MPSALGEALGLESRAVLLPQATVLPSAGKEQRAAWGPASSRKTGQGPTLSPQLSPIYSRL